MIVDESTIARIYRNVDLGRRMRERFDWTVDLDPRYRVLAYIFAYLEHEGAFSETRRILPEEILSWANYFWPGGFSATGTNVDELNGLLEEMVGLGVLSGSGSRGYRLRSPNVVRLLGGPHEVEREIEAFKNRKFEPQANPNVIRRACQHAGAPASPLTLEQEGHIIRRETGVEIIIGSDALGGLELGAAIESLAEAIGNGGVGYSVIEGAGSATSTMDEIRHVYANKKHDHLLLPVRRGSLSQHAFLSVLSQAADWAENRIRTERRSCTIVFSLPPADALALRSTNRHEAIYRHEKVRTHRLHRWKEIGLRQWFDDVGLPPPEAESPKRWIHETGGWPILLRPLLNMVIGGPTSETEFAPPDATIDAMKFVKAAGLGDDADLRNTFLLVSQIGEEVDVENDLMSFKSDLGLDRELIRCFVEHLLELDLLIGSRDRVIAEPVAARLTKLAMGEQGD